MAASPGTSLFADAIGEMSVTRGLTEKFSIADCEAEVFCCRFSPDGKYLAAGCADGAIRVYTVLNGKLSFTLNVDNAEALPMCSLRFRPMTSSSRTKNVLLAVSADGSAQHWHVTSGRRLHSIMEEDNQIFSVDYRADGALFATAGKDKAVRVYDEATKSIVTELAGGIFRAGPGHSNRIFSARFHPTQENILVSGGWDKTVQIWDLRTDESVKSIFGPFICGDAVDVVGNEIVTGSYRTEKQLEVWDMTAGKLRESIPWCESELATTQEQCQLYAAQFSKGPLAGRLIAAGGAGSNDCKVFDHANGNCLVGMISGLSRAVYTVDFSPNSDLIALAGGDSSVRVYNVRTDPIGRGIAATTVLPGAGDP